MSHFLRQVVVICFLGSFTGSDCKSSRSLLLQSPVRENEATLWLLEALVRNETEPTCSIKVVPQTRSGLVNRIYRWQNFYVFIDPVFNWLERRLISNAVARLQEILPCLNFGIWAPNSRPVGDYVHVKSQNGCWSNLGRVGGAQDLSLGPGCVSTRVILHEFLHALGLVHEHSRPDRDNHITVLRQNIRSGCEGEFVQYAEGFVSTFGVPYNQNSIMHYFGRQCSSNGQPTMIAKNGGFVGPIGQDLQQTDIDILRRMYNC